MCFAALPFCRRARGAPWTRAEFALKRMREGRRVIERRKTPPQGIPKPESAAGRRADAPSPLPGATSAAASTASRSGGGSRSSVPRSIPIRCDDRGPARAPLRCGARVPVRSHAAAMRPRAAAPPPLMAAVRLFGLAEQVVNETSEEGPGTGSGRSPKPGQDSLATCGRHFEAGGSGCIRVPASASSAVSVASWRTGGSNCVSFGRVLLAKADSACPAGGSGRRARCRQAGGSSTSPRDPASRSIRSRERRPGGARRSRLCSGQAGRIAAKRMIRPGAASPVVGESGAIWPKQANLLLSRPCAMRAVRLVRT